MREFNLEDYFKRRVKETGGIERKVKWPGRNGAPDRMAGWAVTQRHALVELKRTGGEPEGHQAREHQRLRSIGFDVWVIDSKQGVDIFIAHMSH